MPEATCKVYHINVVIHTTHFAFCWGIELTTFNSGTDCIGRCRSNYYMITTITQPRLIDRNTIYLSQLVLRWITYLYLFFWVCKWYIMTENVGVVFLFVIIKVKDIIKTFTYTLLVGFFCVWRGRYNSHEEPKPVKHVHSIFSKYIIILSSSEWTLAYLYW